MRIRIDLKQWFRNRIENNADPQYQYLLFNMYGIVYYR
jgi:hypothetical protein